MSPEKEVQRHVVGVWCEHLIEVSSVMIPHALLGATLAVVSNGLPVTLVLPGSETLGRPAGNPRLVQFRSHIDGDPSKNGYEVHRLQVKVAPGVSLDLPRLNPKDDKIAFDAMYAVVKATAPVAEKVFDDWTRIARWKHFNRWIGRPNLSPEGWRGRLHLSGSEELLLSTGSTTFRTTGGMLTVDGWAATVRSMVAGETSPLSVDLVLDGQWHLELGDVRRCIVDTAVGCEVYLRTKVLETIPAGKLGLRRHLERAPISTLRDKLFPDIIPFAKQTEWERIKGPLAELFEIRNALMHRGSIDIPVARCKVLCEGAATLLTLL